MPILSLKNTALLCLSSPEGDESYYSGLLNLKRPSGESFFNVIECIRICERCRKLERAKAILCKHVPNKAPWLSGPKMDDLKLLYKTRPEDAMREFGGMVVSNHLPALPKEQIATMFSLPRTETLAPPPFIFTTCDPSGAGPSMLSFCSGYYDRLGNVVVRRNSPSHHTSRASTRGTMSTSPKLSCWCLWNSALTRST